MICIKIVTARFKPRSDLVRSCVTPVVDLLYKRNHGLFPIVDGIELRFSSTFSFILKVLQNMRCLLLWVI